jgi:S1-C subfamily serine protease
VGAPRPGTGRAGASSGTRPRRGWSALLAALVLVLAGCEDDPAADEPTEAAPEAPAEAPADGAVDPFAGIPDLVEDVLPSTVTIEASGTMEGQAVQGAASGVIWDADGLVVTNAHVVAPATELTVVLADGSRHAAEVVAMDERTDVAILAIEAGGLPEATFAGDLPRIGELAVAIGNPLGFQDTATAGIVSGVDRSLPAVEGGPVLVGLIQTDAAISSGNSGGALVNADGLVIGVNVAVVAGQVGPGVAQNLGFAIPATTVTSVVEELLERGEVAHAYLGVQGVGLTPQLAERFGHDRDRGVVIGRVEPGSPADEAALRAGDIVVALDGEPVDSLVDLLAALRNADPGDEIVVTVVRNGDEEDVGVTLGELPAGAG